MQPLDNGPFNAVKSAYRKELKKFNFSTDARPVDKINFIKAYNKARKAGLAERNILSAFRTTENWPISRWNALAHSEIQQDVEKKTPERELGPAIEHDPEVTPKTSRQVRDYGKNKSPTTRSHYNTIAKGYTQLEFKPATKNDRIPYSLAKLVQSTVEPLSSIGQRPYSYFLSETLA
jgi:hypothetical protein